VTDPETNHTTLPLKLCRGGLLLFVAGFPVSHVPAQFGIALATVGWLLEGVLNKRWQVRWHPFLGILGFYLVWNVLSAMFSPRPLHSILAVADNEWAFLIMLMMFWNVRDRAFLKRLVWVYLSVSSVAIVYGILQVFGGVEYYRHIALSPMGRYFRAVGFHGFYLTFAVFAMSVLFLSGAIFLERGVRRGWHLASLAVAGVLAIVGTFARSVWLALVPLMPLLGFARSRKIGIALTLTIVVGGGAMFLSSSTIRDRALSTFEINRNETRILLWETALRIARAHPVLGVGEDNWDYYFPLFRVEGDFDTTVHPHNDYLNVLVNSGVPGFLAFLALWGTLLASGFRSLKYLPDTTLRGILRGGLLTILGLLISSMFNDYYGTFIPCLEWWFVTGLVLTAGSFSEGRGEVLEAG
jgi:O-antigen ligase